MSKVDIILLTMNQLRYTKECIRTLYKNTAYPFNLIVVDNASNDGTVAYLRALKRRKDNIVLHLNGERDSGFSEGVNTGLKYCKSDYILILNNDVSISQGGWLENMVKVIESDNKIGAVGCKLLYPDGRIQHAGAYFTETFHWEHIGRGEAKESHSTQREVIGVTFACILLRREAIPEGLDQSYLLGLWEDVAFCCNLRKNGWKIIYTPKTVLTHYESKTILAEHKYRLSRVREKNAARFHVEWDSWLKEDKTKNPTLYNN